MKEQHKEDAKFRLPKFESEILLQQAIAGLLARMPNITGVQILQGAQEYGKDIIFYTQGPLGESLPCACVIKNTKISGAVGQDKGARTVFEQVEQALDTPFLDGAGEEVRVHRVYVISPAEITQIAINSIKGKLATRSGQVMFFGGDSLFQLFRDHWQDFFADEFTAIEKYLKEISELGARSALMGLTNLYAIGELDKSDTAIYVERSLYRQISVYSFKSMKSLLWGEILDRDKQMDKETLLRARERIDLFRKSLRHIQNWGYIKPKIYSDNHEIQSSFEYLDQAFTSFTDLFISSWLSSARK